MKNPFFEVDEEESDSSKLNLLNRDLKKLEIDIEKRTNDIVKLDDKEKFFLEEIEKLRFEHEQTKKRVLDEGKALGLYDTANRQYSD